MTGTCEAGGCIVVADYGTAIRLRSTQTGTTMQATPEEWLKFVAEVRNGDWDHIGQTAEATA